MYVNTFLMNVVYTIRTTFIPFVAIYDVCSFHNTTVVTLEESVSTEDTLPSDTFLLRLLKCRELLLKTCSENLFFNTFLTSCF